MIITTGSNKMQSLKSTQIICVKLHQHPEIHVDVKHQMLLMSLLATLLKDQQFKL